MSSDFHLIRRKWWSDWFDLWEGENMTMHKGLCKRLVAVSCAVAMVVGTAATSMSSGLMLVPKNITAVADEAYGDYKYYVYNAGTNDEYAQLNNYIGNEQRGTVPDEINGIPIKLTSVETSIGVSSHMTSILCSLMYFYSNLDFIFSTISKISASKTNGSVKAFKTIPATFLSLFRAIGITSKICF